MNTINPTSANDLKKRRTNKITTTVMIGLTTLLIGMVVGAAAAETGTGLSGPTATAKSAGNPPSPAGAGMPQSGGLSNWNPVQAMQAMQAQMNQSFDQMFDQFRATPDLNKFKPDLGYSLSLNVRDLKDHYEVRAYLPDAKASDVQVSLNHGQTLDVQVNRQQTQKPDQKNMETSVSEWGQYEQEIQLPEPAKAGQMKIQREGHELVINIPKAA